MKKRVLAIFISVLMVLTMLPTTALAEGADETGGFIVTGGTLNQDYTFAGNILTIHTDTPLTISGTTTNLIQVNNNVNANLTLSGLNIDVSWASSA